MDQPVVFSDFARPICLPSSDEFIHMGASCVTLAWDGPGTYVLKDVICIFFGWVGFANIFWVRVPDPSLEHHTNLVNQVTDELLYY